MEVISLFPSTICVTEIDTQIDELEGRVYNSRFGPNGSDGNRGSERSETLDLLSSFPDCEAAILRAFDSFKNGVLRLEATEFVLTTSWATRTMPGCSSNWHVHCNSMYSGLLYFGRGGPLEFESVNLKPVQLRANAPSEWNIHNANVWGVAPERGRLVFFPSYLLHRIAEHSGAGPRYSVAFNLMPSGRVDLNDSSINFDVGYSE